MRAITTNPTSILKLALLEAPQPKPASNEALVRVKAFSLNAGETRTALEATKSYVPGWDFAGVVEETAADGSSPQPGAKVFGFVAQEMERLHELAEEEDAMSAVDGFIDQFEGAVQFGRRFLPGTLLIAMG